MLVWSIVFGSWFAKGCRTDVYDLRWEVWIVLSAKVHVIQLREAYLDINDFVGEP
jgi:hypothetical protein